MRESRCWHLLAATAHHIRERPGGHAEPARHHHRPGGHVQPGQRRTRNHAVARDRRRGGTHHDRGRAGGHGGETGVRHNAPAKRRQRADGCHLGARDRRRDRQRRQRLLRRRRLQRRVVAPQGRLDHGGDRILGRWRLQQHRLAGRRALARIGQPRQYRRRRLGRDPESRLGGGVHRPLPRQEGGPGRRRLDGRRKRRAPGRRNLQLERRSRRQRSPDRQLDDRRQQHEEREQRRRTRTGRGAACQRGDGRRGELDHRFQQRDDRKLHDHELLDLGFGENPLPRLQPRERNRLRLQVHRGSAGNLSRIHLG